jgi:hypothetical protein
MGQNFRPAQTPVAIPGIDWPNGSTVALSARVTISQPGASKTGVVAMSIRRAPIPKT